MIKYVAAAAFSLLAFQPASAATVFDYNVYASGDAQVSGGSYGDVASTTFRNSNGPTGQNITSTSQSSTTLTASAASLSSELKGLASTGTVASGQYTPGNVTLTGSTSGVNVFNIDGSQWSQFYALTFSGLGSGAIVNISGSSLTNFVNLNFGSLSADQVIFNFYDATNVSMSGMNVKGSILAPSALVNLQGGSVAGSVISKDFLSGGTTVGGGGFTGYTQSPGAVSAVPEPSVWALLILGFGIVGAALRRRAVRGFKPQAA